jgi:hypothetical protein
MVKGLSVSKSFWSYQSDFPTPTVADLPAGSFNGTQEDFETLSPGMRREILRRAAKIMLDAAVPKVYI